MVQQWSRRDFLLAGAATALLVACHGDDGGTSAGSTSDEQARDRGEAEAGETSFTAADFDGLAICILTPEQAAGPFPLDEQFVRRDITEGYGGHPLRLGFRVVDAGCEPIAGAAVEVWHTDATGDYSAFADGGGGKDEVEGTTFMRGTQIARDDGIVEFATVYPGWYPGRAPHIHVRVHRDDAVALTSQVYFDEGYSEAVYGSPPYDEFGLPDTTWADDTIAGDPLTDGTALFLTRTGPGTRALLNLGVA